MCLTVLELLQSAAAVEDGNDDGRWAVGSRFIKGRLEFLECSGEAVTICSGM